MLCDGKYRTHVCFYLIRVQAFFPQNMKKNDKI